MNKILYVFILLVISSGLVYALNFLDYDDAMNYFRTYKENRESDIEKISYNIVYTTDKDCRIVYDTEQPECRVCANLSFTIDKELVSEINCYIVPYNTTSEQIDEDMEDLAVYRINQNYPKEDIEFVDVQLKDRELNGVV